MSEEEAEANTRLIAAAPDLLAAVDKIITWWEASSAEMGQASRRLWESSYEPLTAARAAIAKVKGE